jgi:hypothetical protein
LRSPALVSRSLNPERHAVLASLSGRYPPLEGRSPTCYSPVRHSTQGRSPFRVRLACVRHAASVDSEPGSNSQVEFLREPLIACSQTALLLLSCVVLRYRRTASLALGRRRVLHALSSFQRTKDLVFLSPRTRHPFCWILLRPFLGEPFKLTTTSPSLSTNISHFGENPLVTCPAARCS